jgi:hypothetical protein
LAVSGFASRCSLFLHAGLKSAQTTSVPAGVSVAAAEVKGVRRTAAAGPPGTWMG